MNLRTLKKLSKRAAPLLGKLGDRREQFRAEADDSYISTLITARKHWERHTCHPSYEPKNRFSGLRGTPIKRQTRTGRFLVVEPPNHPRKGTIMVGWTCGGEEPEWAEGSAWEALFDLMFWEFAGAVQEGDDVSFELTRPLNTPRQVLGAARDAIAARKAAEVDHG